MNGTDMLKQEAEFHYRYIRKQVERLEEMKREGRRYIDIPIDEVITMLMENHALHQHLDKLQEHMALAYRATTPLFLGYGAIAPGTDVIGPVPEYTVGLDEGTGDRSAVSIIKVGSPDEVVASAAWEIGHISDAFLEIYKQGRNRK